MKKGSHSSQIEGIRPTDREGEDRQTSGLDKETDWAKRLGLHVCGFWMFSSVPCYDCLVFRSLSGHCKSVGLRRRETQRSVLASEMSTCESESRGQSYMLALGFFVVMTDIKPQVHGLFCRPTIAIQTSCVLFL